MAQSSSILKSLSGLLSKRGKRQVNETAATPEWYLKLTTKCTEQADKWISGNGDLSLKFNDEQCKYLVHKLKTAVGSANQFLGLIIDKLGRRVSFPPSPEGSVEYVFKLLYALSKEVENFIQGCCKGAWMESAFMLGNKSAHVAALASDLEWCTIVFSGTMAQVAEVYEAESTTVKKMAALDKENLESKVIKAMSKLSDKSNIEEHHLVTFVLETLSRQDHGSASSQSSQSSASETIMKKMKLKEQLGKGSFGTVNKADWLGTEVAVKTFEGSENSDFQKEVSILRGLCHPNIVSLLGYVTNKRKQKCSIVMELMDEDLHSLLQRRLDDVENHKNLPFTILEGVDMMLQVAQGMFYLHKSRILHRDLKSYNILVRLVKAMEGEIAHVQVKVADFGLSKTKENSMTESKQTPNMGTSRWMAPEVIECGNDGTISKMSQIEMLTKKYPFKSDVYSFGMVCYEILTGNVPFSTINNPNEVKKKIQDGARPELPIECPKELRTLIEACWSLDATTRPCFDDICMKLSYLKWTLLNRAKFCYLDKILIQKIGGPYTQEITKRELVMTRSSHLNNEFHSMFSPRQQRNNFDLWRFQKQVNASTSGGIQVYTFVEVIAMTNHFNRKLGEEWNGSIYYGKLLHGEEVAVKVVDGSSKKFFKEVDILSKVQHKNVVALVGYCQEHNNQVIIFEYMHNGSLFDHLRELDLLSAGMLDWRMRLHIALNAAQALEHLHISCRPSFIHRDVRSSKILLTSKYDAKVAGFELTKMLDEGSSVMSNVKGTLGYLDPEYYSSQSLSFKSDVYSFGIVLLELITGCSPIYLSATMNRNAHILMQIRESLHNNNIHSILDPMVEASNSNIEVVWKVAEIAMQSVEPKSVHRPTMSKVVQELHDALMIELGTSTPFA